MTTPSSTARTQPGRATLQSPGLGRWSARRRTTRSHTRLAIATLVGPVVILFLLTYLAPIAYSIVQSLFSRRNDGLGFGPVETVFVGLENYLAVVMSESFWAAMGRILLFGIVQVPIMLGVATLLALLLDSLAARSVAFFRIAYFLPYAIPGVIAALLWAYLYSPPISPIVQGLTALGIPVDFVGPDTVLWSMANITTWSWTGYNMLIVLSALQAIPRDQYEAARLDGASELAVALRIKLPQIGPALVLSGTLSIIGTIQIFNEPRVLQRISTSVSSDYVPTMAALRAAFQDNDFNSAAAMSVVIALIAGVLSLLYYQLTKRVSS
jgi:multiple sugar transport system permease protein